MTEDWFFELVATRIASFLLKEVCERARDLFGPPMRNCVHRLDRRVRTGFKSDRRMPDPNSDRHRACDDVPRIPRLLAV